MAVRELSLLKKIRQIQFQSTHLADDILAGAYRSAFKGKGMEFEEVREYQPGDEIRTIDWNVTARMDRPYVKTFREERELTVILAVDVSASSRFGSLYAQKNELIAEIGAVIAFSAIKNNDKVGLLLFSDRVEKYLPPRKGTRHVLRVIRELLAYQPLHRGTDVSSALAFLGQVQRRSVICFLISDFICSDYQQALKIIAKEHDLIGVAVTDPFELNFPDLGMIRMQDFETLETRLINTSSYKEREEFAKNAALRIEEQKKIIRAAGASFIDIQTDRPYLTAFKKFFKMREKKRR